MSNIEALMRDLSLDDATIADTLAWLGDEGTEKCRVRPAAMLFGNGDGNGFGDGDG